MTEASPAPPTIGVFDSGFGGLTVLRALIARAPQRPLRLPRRHGPPPLRLQIPPHHRPLRRPKAPIPGREQGAEFLVIACNTASALALDAIQDAVPRSPSSASSSPAPTAARAASRTGDVLVIATDATVQSHAYAAACPPRPARPRESLPAACPPGRRRLDQPPRHRRSHPHLSRRTHTTQQQHGPQSRHAGPRLHPLPPPASPSSSKPSLPA